MTHQYVGAYYVPHGWYENYDPGFQYDPLSTVFYKNAWYILKQPAPVGTEPTNSQYWVQYNMIPGQIIDIENQIQSLNDKIIFNASTSNITNNNVLCIGDSYGANVDGWPEKIKANKYTNLCVPGASIIKSGSQTTYLLELQNANSNLIKEATHLMLFAGYNDFTHQVNYDQFYEGFKQITDYALSINPTIKLYCGFIGSTNQADNLRPTRENWNLAASNAGWTVFPIVPVTNSNMMADYRHPNSDGYAFLNKQIQAALYGGNIDTILFNQDIIHNVTGVTTSPRLCNASRSYNYATFQLINNNIRTGNVTANTKKLIGTINGITQTTQPFTFDVLCYSGSIFLAHITIEGRNLYITPTSDINTNVLLFNTQVIIPANFIP